MTIDELRAALVQARAELKAADSAYRRCTPYIPTQATVDRLVAALAGYNQTKAALYSAMGKPAPLAVTSAMAA